MLVMSSGMNVRLGVDVGASRVKAALGWPDGAVRALTFDGAVWLDAAPHVEDRHAVATDVGSGPLSMRSAAVVAPALRQLTARAVDGDESTAEVVDVVAGPLRRVAAEVSRVVGGVPGSVT